MSERDERTERSRRASSLRRAAFVGVLLGAFASSPVSAQGLAGLEQRVSALFFGELDLREREHQGEDGFAVGQSVAQFTVQLDERLSAFTELTAGAQHGHGFEFEVERLIVRYDFSDLLKISAGRYHTPLGYWNSAYHHGAWLQTTVSRPQAVKFGSNIVPIHFVGALAEGTFGSSHIAYKFGIANGRSAEKINAPGDIGDSNGRPAWLVALNYRPLGRRLLNVGIGAYFDSVEPEVPATLTAPGRVDEQIYSAHVALESETPEFIAEYTYARHKSSSARANVHSAYGQLAYRLPFLDEAFKPYVRVEWLNTKKDDPLFIGIADQDYHGVTVGARWDFSSFAVLKLEVREEKFEMTGRRTAVWAQLAFVFDATSNRGIYPVQTAPKNEQAYSWRN